MKKHKTPDSLTLEVLNDFNLRLREDTEVGRCRVANDMLDILKVPGKVNTAEAADKLLWEFVKGRLDADDYFSALALLVGFDKYDPRPHFSKLIFKTIPEHAKLLFMGCAGGSKTFSAVNWAFADWLRDPDNTAIRIASVSGDHLRSNAWSALVSVYDASVLKLPGHKTDLFIGMDPKNMESGIRGVIFPQDKVVTGRLKGFKPGRRDKRHAKFGKSKRIRLILDEAAQIPSGVYGDLSSVEGSVSGPDTVKIVLCGNPDDPNDDFGKWAAPPNGWESLDMDTAEEWDSKMGYHVVRLDGMKCENVIKRERVYEGLLTYEAFLGYLKKGDNSPAYYTYGRGWFPPSGTVRTIIPLDVINRQRGEAVFIGQDVKNVASVDLAFVADRAVMYTGRYGLASGYRDADGTLIKFFDRLTGQAEARPRMVLQVDGFFELPQNKDTVHRSLQIRDLCRKLRIEPDWVCLDRTGNGEGVYSYLKNYWGNILGIAWNEDSTDIKVLADDDPDNTPRVLYDRITSEMWYATEKWLRAGAVFIGCSIPADPLFTELSSRRGKIGGRNRQRVESKDEYRSRGNDSPDHADSFVMLQQLIRLRSEIIPGLLDDNYGRVNDHAGESGLEANQTSHDAADAVLQEEAYAGGLYD